MERKRRRGAYRYRGILARPRKIGAGPAELFTRIKALCADLEVDSREPEWPLQAFVQLANRHVPGFRIEQPTAGRPPAILPFELVDIAAAVQRTRETYPGISVRAACQLVAGERGMDEEEVRNRFRAFVNAPRDWRRGKLTAAQWLAWSVIFRTEREKERGAS